MSTKIVYGKTAATLAHQGVRYRVLPGEPWDGDDPLVKRYPDFFIDQPIAVRSTETPTGDYKRLDEPEADEAPGDGSEVADAPVERATSAPGERRHAVKKAAKKSSSR